MFPSHIKNHSKHKSKASKSGFNIKINSSELAVFEIHEAHNDFIQYLEKLDETIKEVLARHQTLIKGRYLSASQHLDKVRKNLVTYEEKMLKLEKDLNEDERVKNIVQQIDNFKSFYQILQEKMAELDMAIQSKEQESADLLGKMQEKKNLLLQVHQENIKLSTKILSYKNAFPPTPKQEPTIEQPEPQKKTESSDKTDIKTSAVSAQISLKRIKKDYTAVKYETENIGVENHSLRAEISKKSNQFFQNKSRFQECLRALNRNLLLSQQVTSNQTGLKNSLLFKINKMSSIKPEISRTLSEFKNYEKKSFLQDREVTNVVYSTLQKVVRERKMPKKNIFANLEVTWDEFNSFNPLQIMGLLAVNPKVTDSIFNEFERKEKSINGFLTKVKIV